MEVSSEGQVDAVTTTERGAPQRAALDILKQAVHGATAGTVFGEPITRGAMTIVPVARVSGRGGGGEGGGPASREGAGGGSGGGLVLSARPVGVFVVKEKRVAWRPAVDINRVVLGGQLVAIAALLTVRALVKARRS
jgi:uncharacterized spore protein YtfJ